MLSNKVCMLILEDDPTQLATMQMKLKRILSLGDIVLAAKSGVEAIEVIKTRKAAAERPGIFILDLNMPGEIKGFGVLQWIREQPEYRDCAVIILTTSDAQADHDRAMELGATRYYTKPQSIIEVGPLLKQIVNDFRHVKPGA
jgi:CheY-like chemotaxis protein